MGTLFENSEVERTDRNDNPVTLDKLDSKSISADEANFAVFGDINNDGSTDVISLTSNEISVFDSMPGQNYMSLLPSINLVTKTFLPYSVNQTMRDGWITVGTWVGPCSLTVWMAVIICGELGRSIVLPAVIYTSAISIKHYRVLMGVDQACLP